MQTREYKPSFGYHLPKLAPTAERSKPLLILNSDLLECAQLQPTEAAGRAACLLSARTSIWLELLACLTDLSFHTPMSLPPTYFTRLFVCFKTLTSLRETPVRSVQVSEVARRGGEV